MNKNKVHSEMPFIYLTLICNIIIPSFGRIIFKHKKRKNVLFVILAIIPIIYLIIYRDLGYGLLFVLSPLLSSLWYLTVRYFYMNDLKREPILPKRTGNFDFEEKRFIDNADFLFILLVMIIPIFFTVFIMSKAFPN